MAVDGKYAGHILISDIIKPHAKEAIENLKEALPPWKPNPQEEARCEPLRFQGQLLQTLPLFFRHQ